MAGNSVNVNQGLDIINQYLKDLGINKTVTSKEVSSIFESLEKNEDGTVDTSAFALAVANAYSEDEMTALEDEFLEAWAAVSGIDGDDETVSSDDIAGLESTSATEETGSSESSASGSGATPSSNGGGQTPNTNNNLTDGTTSSIQAATLTGNETVAELEAGRSDALAQLSELQAQKDNNEAVQAAEQSVEDAKATYDEKMEEFEKNEAELYEKVADTQAKKEENDAAISEQKGVIDGVKSDISSKQSELSSLVEPSQSDFAQEDEDGNVTYPGYDEAVAAYQQEKAALEAELADLQAQLADEEAALADLEAEGVEIDTQLAEILNSQEMQESEYAQAALEAFNVYIDAQINLESVKSEQTAQIDADIAQLRENVATYDSAIDEAKAAEEAEQAEQTQEAEEAEEAAEEESLLQPEEEECIADPIGFAFEDENGNSVDLKLIQDDGAFDSVSDFVGSAEGGISDLTKLADENGIINAQTLAENNIKFATVIDGQTKSLSFEEVQEMYGISDIQIDVSKIDPNYEGDQEFGVSVNFAEQTDKNGNVTKEATTQDVTGYSTYQTAEEIKAMEGYGNLIGDYSDTYRDENGVLKDLPEQFKDSEYAKYIHVDENGNYYVSIDTDDKNWNINGQNENDSNGESLDEIITELYSLDTEAADYETTLASLKAAIKVANAAEQKASQSSSADGSIYIYGNKGTISSNLTEDGAKLLLVDKDAALENITPESEWYKKSEGNEQYRNWAASAAADTELAEKLTASQGFTRDSEGRKVLDETSEEFSNLLNSLTNEVVDEDGNVTSTPQQAWANADFSQYSPETVLKLAEAFENNVGADGRTFLDAAQYYCGNGQAKDELNAVTDAILSKAGNEQSALDMISKEIETALANGDTESIKTLLNAAKNNQLDMQTVLKQYENNNAGMSLSDGIEKLDITSKELETYKGIISDCEDAIDNNTKDLINRLGSSVDEEGNVLSGVAEKAWDELNISEMSSAELLDLQKDYDSVYGAGSFLERAEQLYPENSYDRIMNAVDNGNADKSANGSTKIDVNGSEQSINDFIKSLDYASGVNNLETLSDEDIATVARVYDGINGEGSFKAFMENCQTEYAPSESYQIKTKLAEANADAAVTADQNEKTEKLNSYIDQITNSANYLRPGERPDDEYFMNVIENALAEMDNLSDPMALLETLKEEQPKLIKSMNEDNTLDAMYVDIFENMANGDVSVDEMIALDTRYKELTGKSSVELTLDANAQETYVDTVIGLYAGASVEDIEKLNSTFNPIELIQDSFDGDKTVQAEKMTDLFSNMFGDTDSFMDEYAEKFEAEWGQSYESYFTSEFGNQGEESFVNVLQTIGDGIFVDADDAKAALLYAADGDVSNIVEYFTAEETLLSEDEIEAYMPMVMDLFKGIVPSEQDGTVINSAYLEPAVEESDWAKEFSDEDTLAHIELLEANARTLAQTKDDDIMYDDYIKALEETPILIRDTLMDENVPIADKIAILEDMSQTNPDAVNTFLYSYGGAGYSFDENDNPVYTTDIISDMFKTASIEEIIKLDDVFNSINGIEEGALSYYMFNNLSNNSDEAVEFNNNLISLYVNATPTQKAELDARFDIASMIQDTLSGDTETAVVNELFNKSIESLPDNINAYAKTQSEKERLEILASSKYITSNSKDTIYNILTGYNKGNLTANEAAYLLTVAGVDTETISSLATGFRDMTSGNEEKLLPAFIDIFAALDLNK